MVSRSYYYAVGRRKTSVAQVRLYSGGKGAVVINGKPMEDLFSRLTIRETILQPLKVTETIDGFNATVKVAGGGVSGWAGAISLGIARALVKADESLRLVLRRYGLMTRDPRVKERKKYGLKRARKAPQYTKR